MAYSQDYYARNRKRIAAYQKKYREKNPEKVRENGRSWRAKQKRSTEQPSAHPLINGFERLAE